MKKIIFGYRTVIEAIENDRIKLCYCSKKIKEDLEKTFKNVKFVEKSKIELDKIAGGGVHNFLIGEVDNYYTESTFEEVLNCDRILILEGIQDPHNFGSLIRSAAILGYNIVYSKNNTCGINQTVVKVASGGVEHTRIHMIGNIASFLEKIKHEGFFVFSFDFNGVEGFDTSKIRKIAIIIGGEGEGISQNLLKKSDVVLKIKGNENFGVFNASVAGAIAMHMLRK